MLIIMCWKYIYIYKYSTSTIYISSLTNTFLLCYPYLLIGNLNIITLDKCFIDNTYQSHLQYVWGTDITGVVD